MSCWGARRPGAPPAPPGPVLGFPVVAYLEQSPAMPPAGQAVARQQVVLGRPPAMPILGWTARWARRRAASARGPGAAKAALDLPSCGRTHMARHSVTPRAAGPAGGAAMRPRCSLSARSGRQAACSARPRTSPRRRGRRPAAAAARAASWRLSSRRARGPASAWHQPGISWLADRALHVVTGHRPRMHSRACRAADLQHGVCDGNLCSGMLRTFCTVTLKALLVTPLWASR